jgi:hypothetical protein
MKYALSVLLFVSSLSFAEDDGKKLNLTPETREKIMELLVLVKEDIDGIKEIYRKTYHGHDINEENLKESLDESEKK